MLRKGQQVYLIMVELIAVSVLVFSFIGATLILYWKLPLLGMVVTETAKLSLTARLKRIIKKNHYLSSFSFGFFLQKFLLRLKILTLKTENKINDWIEKLRKGSGPKDNSKDDYWEELKKVKKS